MESFNTALKCADFLIPWNAVMLALGILAAVVAAEILVKKRGLYKDLALDCCIIAIPSGIVGARLFSALSGKIAWTDLLRLSEVGLNLYGAILFASIGILIYCAVKKFDIGTVFDALAPAALFGMAVGRWSDFFLCEGLGSVAGDVPKFFPLVTFTKLYFVDHSTVAYAVFFLDSLICLALGITALTAAKKARRPGKAAFLSILVYILCAFVLEALRDGSARQIVFGSVRFNQLVLTALLVLLVAVSLISAKHSAPEQTPNAAEPNDPEPEHTEEPSEPEVPQPEQSETEEQAEG